jgi:hypothetical protein
MSGLSTVHTRLWLPQLVHGYRGRLQARCRLIGGICGATGTALGAVSGDRPH